jgi:hypothetical protein
MASLSQIEANRRNAHKSTGPKTEAGKRRSRRNAVRHGLTAETVVEVLEDPEDYKAFELSVTSEFDAQTAVERELVLRLASLLWRLRRATAIETGLLQIQGEILRESRQARGAQSQPHDLSVDMIFRFGGGLGGIRPRGDYEPPRQHDHGGDLGRAAGPLHSTNVEIGRCFLRLANLDNGAFDRLSRYETALWRQVGQILFVLDPLRRSGHSKPKRPRTKVISISTP